ncbi:MAG: histidinol-phosphate transaminase [Phycisphaerae bacterium]|jgi:histidinol-phosphate aminotransferase
MSYFRKAIDALEAYVPGYQPGDEGVIKLNTNENAFPPSSKVFEALRSYDAALLRRYPAPLGDDFRCAAAELHGLDASNIICTNGGDDLLTICMRAFCDASRPVCWPTPTYSLYDELAALQECAVKTVPYKPETVTGELAKIAAPLTILCNPNAPTADFICPQTVAKLAANLVGKGVLLIDEAYVDFAPADCSQLVTAFDNIVILRSMSKGYSLAGIRFGYGIASASLMEGLIKVKDSYNVDRLAVELATAAIKDRAYFEQTRDEIKRQRSLLTAGLRELGFELGQSSTNFLLARHESAAEIYKLLREENIIVRYFNLRGLEDKLRITVGSEQENKSLLGALGKILAKLN